MLAKLRGTWLLIVAAAAACDRGPTATDFERSDAVTIRLLQDTVSLLYGTVIRLEARLEDSAGTNVAGRLSWWTGDRRRATVDTLGTVTTHGLGDVWVFVNHGQLLDSALVRIVVRFASVFAGSESSCGLATTGHAICWGWNAYGQLGNGTTTDALNPVLSAPGYWFGALASGGGTTCGFDGGSGARCWGYNGVGQLADSTIESRPYPVHTARGLFLQRLVFGSGSTICGLADTGAWWCWGWNLYGQLLDGTRINRRYPIQLVVPDVTFTWLTAGVGHMCGLDAGGAAWCWGRGEVGQLGDGTVVQSRDVPQPVSGAVLFAGLATGEEHTCGWTADGVVYCWGGNGAGQSGGPDRIVAEPWRLPTALAFDTVVSSRKHSCGLAKGVALCWGANDYGQLGRGFGGGSAAVEPVNTSLQFASISTGSTHTCGIAVDGVAYCWGRNRYGALGSGTRTDSHVPVRVRFQP